MLERINQMIGGDGGRIVQMVGALLIVIVLIVLVSWIVRRLGGSKAPAPVKRSDRAAVRLAVVDAAHVDGQRRLVLVRRDEVEHLVMIGGPNDVLIEPRIVRGQPHGGQRQAPQQMAPAQPAPPVQAPRQPTLQQPVATAPQVPVPPPFIEPVTSPAAAGRGSPVAADLRAAIGDPRTPVEAPTRAMPPQAREPAPQPQAYANEPDLAATRMAPRQAPAQMPEPAYDDATVPVGYAPQRPAAPRAAPQPAPYQPAAYEPEPTAPTSLEDMIAGGLEEAMMRPDPAPRPAPAARMAAPQAARAPVAPDPRLQTKDAIASDIERAIHDLTSGVQQAPSRAEAPYRAEPAYRGEPRGPRNDAPRAPVETPTRQTRMSGAAPGAAPSAPRQMPNVNARPFLVQSQEPAVAMMPTTDAIRAEAKRSTAEIEDEMARLLSELTGTTQR